MATAVINPQLEISELRRKGFVTEEKVLLMLERIIAKSSPRKIVVFGSRARGSQKPWSDLDVMVLYDRYDPRTDYLPINHSDLKVWMSVDMLVASIERHEYMKDAINSVHCEIEREGVTVYDADAGSIDHGAVARIAR